MYPLWVTANTGNLPAKVTSTKLSYNPSTGLLTSVGLKATGTISTGTASGTTGQISFIGTTSGTAIIKAADVAGSATLTIGATTGTIAVTANKLSDFSATTSAELAGVISDETGSGKLVFGTAPTLASTVTIGTAGGTTGAINLVGTTSGTVTLSVADAAGTWTMKLPADD